MVNIFISQLISSFLIKDTSFIFLLFFRLVLTARLYCT